MKHHSTVSERDRMERLGLGGGGDEDTESSFHDMDEVIASPLAECYVVLYSSTATETSKSIAIAGN